MGYSKSKTFSAIYAIQHRESGRIYVGSATHLLSRWGYHRDHLKLNSHINRYLQNAWNKYGADAFDWIILERVEPADLVTAEQKWIDYYQAAKRRFGFNINPTASSPLGRKFTKAQRRRMSARAKAAGRKCSEEQKAFLSALRMGNQNGVHHHHGNLTPADIREIFELIAANVPVAVVAERFHKPMPTINRIIHRKLYNHIPIPPLIEYAACWVISHRPRRNQYC